MTNYVQLQEDLTFALLSAASLANINVVQYRKLRLQGQIDLSAIYQIVRNGRSGCGILVEMPSFEVAHPNLLGPEGDLVMTFAVIEEPNLNFEPTGGTLLSAEDVAQTVLDELHGYFIAGLTSLYADKTAVRSADEFQGLVAYRVQFRMRQVRAQTPRVATPSITNVGNVITLACATPGADIYYTLDGTFPGQPNPGAVKYLNPFPMGLGLTLRVAAWAQNFTGSFVTQATS